jgi:hypothetical protein
MPVIIHKLDVDPVTLRVTMEIQFSESEPVETRHATYVTVGDNGWKLACEDDLTDKLLTIATQAGLRPGAIGGELLLHVRDALHCPDRVRFPILLNGLPLKPARWRSIWANLKLLLTSRKPLRAATPRQP